MVSLTLKVSCSSVTVSKEDAMSYTPIRNEHLSDVLVEATET